MNVVSVYRLCFTVVLLCSWSALGKAKENERPNIIYVMTDDLGYGDLGCYGQKVIRTPNLDRMASEGMRFTDHYAGHTVCRPSRLVLWTGKHVGNTGLMGNRPRSLSGTETTVAKLLQNAGYVCGGVGKWALGHVENPSEIDNPGHPNRNGFDYWHGYMNQSQAHNYYPLHLWENDRQVLLPGNELLDHPQARGRVSSKRETYSHDVMTDAAMQFIRRNHRDPFLLHIHWTVPHANNEGGRVLKDGMEIPSYGGYANRDWPNPEKGFAAMVTRLDADMGRLFKLLKELAIDDNTIVFFTSDNGPHREGNHDHEFFDSNGPLKGYKRSMHDGGIRVPMIVRWPGKVQPGVTTDLPSAFWDYLPTACELAGVAAPDGIDGLSYLPTLLSQQDQPKHRYLYWASQEGETTIGVRKGHWKLVRYRKDRDGRADWRLYDLRNDVGEENDVSEEHPETVRELIDLLKNDDLPLIANRN
ncbi:arylsulfatase [Roseiconus lacunae]|uniref:arylsulfatase n=1 Tax=Roseiconus lacunae TaxID=2605694 RepID=UPI001E2A05AB|nr:arylsulfatase [Roseiconus lacunae]MCD0460725.1 arylsulfatase [Roseiconus lacunae]